MGHPSNFLPTFRIQKPFKSPRIICHSNEPLIIGPRAVKTHSLQSDSPEDDFLTIAATSLLFLALSVAQTSSSIFDRTPPCTSRLPELTLQDVPLESPRLCSNQLLRVRKGEHKRRHNLPRVLLISPTVKDVTRFLCLLPTSRPPVLTPPTRVRVLARTTTNPVG